MKIWVYTLCYNEIDILPFVVDYWKLYADKVIVYDNGSTDGSIEFLKKYNWIEVRHFSSGNSKNNRIQSELKSEAWMEAKDYSVDFVQVCDIDEVLYAKTDIKELLSKCKDTDYIWCTLWNELVSLKFPAYVDNKLIHELEGVFYNYLGTPRERVPKYCLFKPDKIKSVTFGPGCHIATFIAEPYMLIPHKSPHIFDNKELMLLHLNRLGIDYVEKKNKKNSERLSKEDIRKHYGVHYFVDADKIKNSILNSVRKGKKL